nr:unnamed protein product [Digitaria exilis]
MGNASGRADDADMDEGFGAGNHVRRASSSARGGGSPPGSPPRPHSPRMFVPQSPVTPLQRAAEVPPPVFNQILMNQQQDDSDGPPQKKIPTLLTKPVEKSGKDHTILLMLSSGVHRYRFIVDGERRFIPDIPFETDITGQIVNLVDVHDFIPESVESVSELTAPPSPDSSYSFYVPGEKEFAKEPPQLPAQLYLGVLNSRGSEEGCARPRHVVLDHLYIEKGWGSQPLVALGYTHRFRSKYVTCVMYKAIER